MALEGSYTFNAGFDRERPRAARRAAGLENADVVQQTLIHLNEIGAEEPIEAELVTALEGPQCS